MAGIYLHIPFCRQACYYCDFHFSTSTRIKTELLAAMGEEILLQRNYLDGEALRSIYFGGGTPSLLDASEVEYLLRLISDTHKLQPDVEVTLEANPDDLSLDKLKQLRSLGVNRLSIGIQSFDDDILRYLHRVHRADTATQSVEHARSAGFDNISIDLIYAIPGLSSNNWEASILKATALQPQHISAYTLTIEEKTTFGNWMKKGRIQPVAETLAAEQQEILMTMLPAAGYRQYEISNFALPGYESRHNSAYWKGEKYLGIGPSAHSYNQRSRQHNVANNYQYVRALKDKVVPALEEALTPNEQINEYILTSLRTDAGCNLDVLRQQFNYDLMVRHGTYIKHLQSHNLIAFQPPHLRLTVAGRLLADKISEDLFLIE